MSTPGPFTFPTFSGVRFNLDDPRPEDVRGADIAHALSRICRYGGHVGEHYSVAQHSTMVAWRVRTTNPGDLELELAALLHDGAEAYVGDVIRPLKRLIGDAYMRLETRVADAVFRAFGLDPALASHAAIVAADMWVYALERRDVAAPPGDLWDVPHVELPPERLTPLRAELASCIFYDRLVDLVCEVGT